MANRNENRKKLSRKTGSARTLLCLLQGLQSHSTTVELRNEITVCGTVDTVDDKMNTVIRGASYQLLNGQTQYFEEMFILGCQIRYVHIPEGVNVMEIINKKVQGIQALVQGRPAHSRQKVSAAKRKRYAEERRIAREYKLGRGREDKDTSATSDQPTS